MNRFKTCFTEEKKDPYSNFPMTQSSLKASRFRGNREYFKGTRFTCVAESNAYFTESYYAPRNVNDKVELYEEVVELTNHTIEIASLNETQLKEVVVLSFKPNPNQLRKAKEVVEMR